MYSGNIHKAQSMIDCPSVMPPAAHQVWSNGTTHTLESTCSSLVYSSNKAQSMIDCPSVNVGYHTHSGLARTSPLLGHTTFVRTSSRSAEAYRGKMVSQVLSTE